MSKINKSFNLKSYLVVIVAMLFMVGCGSGPSSPQEAFEESQEAMEEIDSVIVDQFDRLGKNESDFEYQIDQKNDVIHFENKGKNVEAVVEGNEITVKDTDENVVKQKDSEELKIIRERTSFQLDPLDVFEQLDEEIIDKFTMETEEEDIVLTYEGEEAESKDLATQFFLLLTEGIDENTEENIKAAEERDLSDFKLNLTMDKSDYLLKDMAISMQTQLGEEDVTLTFDYEYSKYNEEMDITPLEETVDKADPEVDTDINEEEATAYLEALLQATIYQDVDGYIKALPETMQDSDTENDGEFQRDMFKNYYVENTKQNMAGIGIEEDKFEDLGDAFLGALQKTKYEVISADIVENRVVVTLSVEGINDSKVYMDTNDKVEELAEKEDLEMEELANKNIDMLIEAYKDVEITDPIDIQVNVSKLAGDYQVLLQDEFLIGGFVQ